MFTAFGFAFLVFSFLVLRSLSKIEAATKRSAWIAEREEAARAEHRRETAEEREKEKGEKKIAAAVKILREIQKLLKEKNEDFDISIYGKRSDSSFVEFHSGYANREDQVILKIRPDSIALVNVQIGKQASSQYYFPDGAEEIVEAILRRPRK